MRYQALHNQLPQRATTTKTDIRIAVAFGILVFNKNQNMNTVQKLMSSLLYKAKARVKVIDQVQHLNII